MATMRTVLLVGAVMMVGVGVHAQGVVGAAETTLADRTDVGVTVYNSNIALVRDVRKVNLPSGEVRLRFGDVAQQIRPETVNLRSVSAPGALHILEQNYEYDLMSPSKMMEKFVGKKVMLVNFSKEVGFTEQEAELLSVNESPIFRVNNDIYLGHPGTVVLPEIPENLIAKPSLIWLLDNAGQEHTVEVTYLTNGISWTADYVLRLERTEKQLDVEGWVTLANQSGAQYSDAQLKLVAGEVNLAPASAPVQVQADYFFAAKEAPAPPREEAFAEYHLYTLPRRTTIKENESKQVSLLTATGVGVAKRYEYRGDGGYYSQRVPPRKDEKVAVFLEFANREDNRLGMPLPAGVMRVYQEDSDGMLQFAGEDRIEHTPKDEKVQIRLGNAFDVVGERTQTDFQKLSNEMFESAYEIKIRNHKDAEVTVDIVEPMSNDWLILESSHDYKKKDAGTAVFTVSVPKDGEMVVTYRVRVKY